MPTPSAIAFDRVLPTNVGIVSGSCADAPDRQAPSGRSVCRSPHVARSLAGIRPQDRAQAGAHHDGPHGHRSAVPQTPHQPATPRPQGLSLSPAPAGDQDISHLVRSMRLINYLVWLIKHPGVHYEEIFSALNEAKY